MIEPGEFVGIVGSTGGGKTIILELFVRFDQPHQGKILLDGIAYKIIRSMICEELLAWHTRYFYGIAQLKRIYENIDASMEGN